MTATLFKYVRARHLKDILEHGRFRLGTLYEYRDIEEHGQAIGDADEGKHRTAFTSANRTDFNLQDGSQAAQFFRGHITPDNHLAGIRRMVLLPGTKVIAEAQAPDMFVFCASTIFDKALMVEFGYDACIRIEAPHRFFSAISHAIRHQARFVTFSEVVYRDRETSHLNPHTIHPALMKGLDYSRQAEVRALWEPLRENIQPLFVSCRKAAGYCSMVRS